MSFKTRPAPSDPQAEGATGYSSECKAYNDPMGACMSEKHREAIRKVRPALVRDLDVSDVSDVMDHMIQMGIMNDHKREVIMGKLTRKEKVRTFLDILLRSGMNALPVFLESLKVSCTHLYDTLQTQLQSEDDQTEYYMVMETAVEQEDNSDADDGYINGIAHKVSDGVCFGHLPTLTMICHETCSAHVLGSSSKMFSLPFMDYLPRSLSADHATNDYYTPRTDDTNDTSSIDQENTVIVAQGEFLFLEKSESRRIQVSDQPNTMQVRVWDKNGRLLQLPFSALKMHGDPFGEPWFHPIPFSSKQADLILKPFRKPGVFIVYKPVVLQRHRNDDVVFNLSMVTGQGSVYTVVHYHIKGVAGDGVTIFDQLNFSCIQDLVAYYKMNRGRLPCRLRHPPCDADRHILPGDHYDMKWHIEEDSLNWGDKDSTSVAEGEFGKVMKAYKDDIAVAVKFLSPKQRIDPWSFELLFEEAQIMSRMDHKNVVQLQGFSLTKVPFIVMEYLSVGSLLQALKNKQVDQDFSNILSMFRQILLALQYLESLMFVIHGDIAARNILIGEAWCLKLADFGLARMVTEDGYISDEETKIPVKHAAPEVLTKGWYSTKSDIWAAGVVLWEMLSDGHTKPYGKLTSGPLIQFLHRGGRLSCPDDHPQITQKFYSSVTKSCWNLNGNSRPSAVELLDVTDACQRDLNSEMSEADFVHVEEPYYPDPLSARNWLRKIKWKGSCKIHNMYRH